MKVWKTKSGRKIPIEKLTNQHLINILVLLQQKAEQRRLEIIKGLEPNTDDEIISYTWHRFVDNIYFDLEDIAIKRNLTYEFNDKIILNHHRGSLEKLIVSALRNAIDAHGDITFDNASSAAKRIIGVIKLHNRKVCA